MKVIRESQTGQYRPKRKAQKMASIIFINKLETSTSDGPNFSSLHTIELNRKSFLEMLNDSSNPNIPSEWLGGYTFVYWKRNEEDQVELFQLRRNAPVSDELHEFITNMIHEESAKKVLDFKQLRSYNRKNESLKALADDLSEINDLKNKCDRTLVVERIRHTLSTLGLKLPEMETTTSPSEHEAPEEKVMEA